MQLVLHDEMLQTTAAVAVSNSETEIGLARKFIVGTETNKFHPVFSVFLSCPFLHETIKPLVVCADLFMSTHHRKEPAIHSPPPLSVA